MPAFDGGGLQEALAHIEHIVGDLFDAEGGGLVAASHADGADYQLHRAFDAGEAGVAGLEVGGVEQRPQHVFYAVAGLEIGFFHCGDGLMAFGGDFVGGEKLEQAGADEIGGGVLFGDDVDDVVAVEMAGFAQEGFFAVVVVLVAVIEMPGDASVGPDGVFLGADGHILGVAEGPAGESAGAFFDVVLGVVADAHRKEFQQFAAVVFVDGAAVVVVVVQPDQHGGVAGDFQQQVVETAQPVAAEHFDLV